MVPQACRLCSGSTQWDDSANSAVCINCGSLEDSSQTALTDNINLVSGGNRPDISLNPVGGSALRSSSGRALYGQSSKERQNTFHTREMHQFIASILRTISHPGLTERSCHLFDLAMQYTGFRWGHQAKLASGACIALALNESQKGVTMATLATVMCEKTSAITKVYTRLSSLLQVSKVNSDPSLLFPSLQAHLSLLLKNPRRLTTKLKGYLEHLSAMAVLEFASLLSSLLTTSSEFNLIHTPALSCAIFILALEANALKPVPDLQLIADLLGSRLGGPGAGASKWSILDRYNGILRILVEWKSDLPWLGTSVSSNLRKERRIEVSKSLRDIITFRAKKQAREMAEKVAPLENSSNSVSEQLLVESEGSGSSVPRKRLLLGVELTSPKRQETEKIKTMIPEAPLPLSRSSGSDTKSWLRSLSRAERQLTNEITLRCSRLETLWITCRDEGRDVGDDELFEEGELEDMLRSEQEVALLRKANGWEILALDHPETTPCAQQTPLHVEIGTEVPEVSRTGEDEEVDEWRPLSPTLLPTAFLEEDFEDW